MENEIIKVNNEDMTVSARDLYDALGLSRRFSAWFETNSKDFIEGEDYSRVYVQVQANRYGGEQQIEDYKMSVDMAKHLCLMSRTEKGKLCRQYLIDLEKAWNTPEQVMSRALKMADQTIAGLKFQAQQLYLENKEMKPKADFFDAVAGSKDAISIGEAAKVLGISGIGQNKLFSILRDKKILQTNNMPYQEYIDRGYFRVIEQKYSKPNGEICINFKTLIYQRGLDYIRKLVTAA